MLMQIEWLSLLIGPTAASMVEMIIVILVTAAALTVLTFIMEKLSTGKWFN